MGMSMVETKRVLPRYSGTVVCQECRAEYQSGAEFVRGYYEDTGTSTRCDFIVVSSVPEKCCPMCLTPQETKVIIKAAEQDCDKT